MSKQTTSLHPFTDMLGLRVVSCDATGAEAELPLTDKLLNGFGIGHGGVTMTLLDVVMGRAARMVDPQAEEGRIGRVAITANLQVSFLRPAMGQVLKAYAEAVEVEDTQARMKAWVLNDAGKKVAQATAVFKYLRADREPLKRT